MDGYNARLEVDIPYLQPHSACKVCGEQASLYGVVDFTKTCAQELKLAPVGVPVYYYQCSHCQFLFTRAFDKWTVGDFNRHIYNKNYQVFDPDSLEIRPSSFYVFFQEVLSKHRGRIRGLDYGGGNGLLSRLMVDKGYDFSTWDPMEAEQTIPEGKFNFISAIEVAEHVPDPHTFFTAIDRYLSQDGLCFFTTAVQDSADIEDLMAWWYVAPINGHISLYSHKAIEHLCAQYGLRGHISGGRHFLYREPTPLLDEFINTILSHEEASHSS